MKDDDRSPADSTRPTELATVERRDFLLGIGVTLATSSALLSGCSRAPAEKIVPYREQPAGVRVGEAAHYATAMCVDGYAVGVLVESHEGRPTKVEGNPDHPASLGAAGTFEQAAPMELYGASRTREIRRHGSATSRAALDSALRALATVQPRGEGVHLVMPPTSSECHRSALSELRTLLPAAAVHFFTPLSRAEAWRGSEKALGTVVEPRFDLSRAAVVLSVDCDFLGHGPARLALARSFADARRITSTGDEMNRLYVVEAALSVTGQVADHRLALRDSELPGFLLALLRAVSAAVGSPAVANIPASLGAGEPAKRRFVEALARDLVARRGAALVLMGDRQPAALHAAAHALNRLLGADETILTYSPSPILEAGGSAHASPTALSEALAARTVEALLVCDVDLVASAPAELAFGSLIRNAKTSFFFGSQPGMTAAHCEWSAPLAHWLESWGDARAFDGTASIVQPLLEPLYGGRTIDEVLGVISAVPLSARERVRASWRAHFGADFDAEWERSLSRGVVGGTRSASVSQTALRWDWLPELVALAMNPSPALELSLYPDNRTLDGRFAENPWLVELPDAVTKLTWQNAALLAPRTASRLELGSGDVVEISAGGVSGQVAVLVVHGQAENCVALSLGWGRPNGLATGGLNAGAFQAPRELWFRAAHLKAAGRREELALTQLEQTDHGRGDAVLAASTLAAYRRNPDFTKHQRKRQLSLYTAEGPRAPKQWGMAIDLNACIGCTACVVACQAENNIPTVGADGVKAGRIMHWLRIDRYVLPDARVVNEPMACQHCERAPCEYVCPTAATVHSSDGLNQMVYNRCVGTRFCSNNCPYKVRRFNWFNYHAEEPPVSSLVHNPEVTVRARGVMEKCTYCVQRIRKAEIRARIDGGRSAADDLKTACEQACPTTAIVFGDLADPSSRVAQLHHNERAFEVLNELGTAPRTRYLAKLTNPNPELT